MRKLVLGLTLMVLGVVSACTKAPGAPSVSFTSPLAALPANGTTYKFKDQPVSLTIGNAVRTSPATVTYMVEVATDTAFANKVYTKEGVAEGTGTSTAHQIANLAGGVTYYWRWKTVVDGVVGQPSPTQSFLIQQQIIIQPPLVNDPVSGATVSVPRPTFVTRNATRSGLVGVIFYDFQVSTSSGFGTITASATIAEQAGGTTSWTPAVDLPAATLFWRVRATDPSNTEASAFTGGTSFVVQPFTLKNAIVLNNPGDLANWAETTNITLADTSGQYVIVDFDKRQGPGRWPESGFGDGGIQYTLGMCLNVGGQWYCSAVIQFWDGRELEAGGETRFIADDWFYDSRWGAMQGHQPQQGELVGIFVAQGNLRDLGQTSVKERSNVLLIPYGTRFVKK
jgi:hypothetical protein